MRYLIILLLLINHNGAFALADSAATAKRTYRGSQILAGIAYSPYGKAFDNYGNSVARTYNNTQPAATLSLNYRYHKSRKVSYGVVLAYEKEHGDWNKVAIHYTVPHHQAETSFIPLGTYSKTVFSLAPEITWTWWDVRRQNLVRFYGTFGLGVSYKQESDVYSIAYYNSMAYNGGNSRYVTNNRFGADTYISPLGVHVGRKLGCFCEVGVGYKGLLVFGMSYKY